MKKAVVLASGPSLTLEQIDLVRRSGLFTIAVNTTFRKVQFCNVLYGGDRCWWQHHHKEVDKLDLKAKRYSCSRPAEKLYGANYRNRKVKPGYNSGANALELAAHMGFKLVIMLGFDCSVKNGIHHHGPHEKTANPNSRRCEQWKKQFACLNKLYPKVRFVNCSSYTELTCFERAPLEQILNENSMALSSAQNG